MIEISDKKHSCREFPTHNFQNGKSLFHESGQTNGKCRFNKNTVTEIIKHKCTLECNNRTINANAAQNLPQIHLNYANGAGKAHQRQT